MGSLVVPDPLSLPPSPTPLHLLRLILPPTTLPSPLLSAFPVLPCWLICRRSKSPQESHIPLSRRQWHYFDGQFYAVLQPKGGVYTVGDFMTTKDKLQVVKPSTSVNEEITGFPVVDDDWKLVGLVSDYYLLAMDSTSSSGRTETGKFPEADSTWKVFNELQSLLTKTNGKLVADVMTQAPVVVRETTNLEDAARLLLETRYHRLPVVDADMKLVGIITRGDVLQLLFK